MQQQGSHRNTVQKTFQRVIAAFPQQKLILADCCQRRLRVGAHGEIVEAYNADVLRDLYPCFPALDHCGVCHLVMAADDCGDALIQQLWDIPCAGLPG